MCHPVSRSLYFSLSVLSLSHTLVRSLDNDGSLSPAELRQALALAGFNTQTTFVEEIMQEFDTDGDGFIDKGEFQVMMHALYTGARNRSAFAQLKSWVSAWVTEWVNEGMSTAVVIE